jgi:DNA-binding transcriptional ArsR family regulator
MTIAVSSQTHDLDGPAREDIELPAVLHALSDPVRLGIVAAMCQSDEERRCGSFGAPVTKSTLTHHFRVLREAGVIAQRHEGTARLSRLRREDLEDRFPGLLDAVTVAVESESVAAAPMPEPEPVPVR